MWSDVKLHLCNYRRYITACPISSTTADRARSWLSHSFHLGIHRHNRGLHELPLWFFLSSDTSKWHNMSHTKSNPVMSITFSPTFPKEQHLYSFFFLPHPVMSIHTWSPLVTNKQTSLHPVLKKFGDCLPASPYLTAEAQTHDQAEPRGRQREIRKPRKEKQNWGWWEYVSSGVLGELEARILMQSYCDKQDANCHQKQSHISHSWQLEVFDW